MKKGFLAPVLGIAALVLVGAGAFAFNGLDKRTCANQRRFGAIADQ